jgi:16S rRNA (cytidine1402-2'-O)-methyltransferase
MSLFLVATPIGNLADITFRAVEILRNADYILCEDTRHSVLLLKHYEIHKPLKSYHLFNEAASEAPLIHDLKAGRAIALLSDAGTPGIADPGERLVARCVSEGIEVVSIPGPCALIAALVASGLRTDRFQFIGFLPRKASECKQLLMEVLAYPGTTVSYEAPHRLLRVLELLAILAPQRPLVVARELTKRFEELRRGTARELLDSWGDEAPRGEVVLLISENLKGTTEDQSELSPKQHVLLVQEQYQLSRNEAIKLVAQLRGLNKRDLYQHIHRSQE